MADRSVRVRFTADVEGYRAAVRNAAKSTADFGRDVGNTLTSTSAKTQQSLDKVGRSAVVAGGLLVAGFALAEKAVIGFDKQMSEVAAVSSATGDELGRLRQAAIDAGQATVFSASDAAKAEAELAKAGVSSSDILSGGLTGALNLASAGSLDLGTAATFAANAMTTFGLKGSDVGRIADTLAAGANKSAADVDTIGQALQQSGLVASQFGLTMEETVGTLSAFAQAGLKGSDAGTSLKTALQRLSPQSAQAAETMKTLGLNFFDAQGKFVGIAGAAGQLKGALSTLTQQQRVTALQTIFGQDAIRAATILYDQGAEGVNKWTGEVTDSGYAAKVAATKMDNLAGDLENLQGSIETALITGGSKATGVLRALTQQATNVVNGFAQMPDVLQGGAVGFVALAGGGLAFLGVIGTMAPKLAQAKQSLEGMGKAGELLSANLGKIGTAVGVAGSAMAVVTTWQTVMADAASSGTAWAKSITDGFDPAKHSITEISDKIVKLRQGARDLESAKSPTWQLWDADMNSELDAGASGLNTFADSLEATRRQAEDLALKMGISVNAAMDLIVNHTDLGPKLDATSASFDREAAAVAHVTDQMKTQSDLVKAQLDPLFAVTDAFAKNAEAQRKVGDASKAATEGVAAHQADLARRVSDAQSNLAEAQGRLSKATDDQRESAQRAVDDASRSLQQAYDDQANAAGDAEQAQRDLDAANYDAVKSAEAVQVALLELASKVSDGSVTIDAARQNLQSWVDQGLITQEQADQTAEKFQVPLDKATELSNNVALLNATGLTMNVTAPGLDAVAAEVANLQKIAAVTIGIITGQIKVGPDGQPILPAPTEPTVGQNIVGAITAGAPGTGGHAAGGVFTRPHVANVAEAGTGGEAILPRQGITYSRAMGILSTAAGWYGMNVSAPGGGGQVVEDHSQIVVQSVGDLARDVRAAYREKDRRNFLAPA